MSPAERAFIARIQRHAAQLTPELAAAFLQAFARLRASLTEIQLARLIASASVERLIAEALGDPTMERAFLPARSTLRSGVADAVRLHAKDLPGGGKVNGVVAVEFNILSPQVIDAVRTLETRVFQTLKDDIRDTVRAHVENGLRDGVGPRVIARRMPGIIGLAPSQAKEVANYRDALLGRNGRKWSDYTLRDKRFDATIRRMLGTAEGLPEAQVEKMVAAYEKRRIAQNTLTNAKTAALDAQRLGQRLSWEDAVSKGIVDARRLMKRWITVGDSRVRPEHREMNGQVARFDEPFSNGELIPGSTTWNCRCIARYFVAALRVAA